MMHERSTISILSIGLFLFALLNAPEAFTSAMRKQAASWIEAPQVKHRLEDRLADENEKLKKEVGQLEAILAERQTGRWEIEDHEDPHWREYFNQRLEELKERNRQGRWAVACQVVFRDPSSWGSSLWIGVGEKTNRSLGVSVIAKNSPVVAGGALVGVVEEVGQERSRVRLITDSSLVPAVRAVRGGRANRLIGRRLDELSELLSKRVDLFESADEKGALIGEFEKLKKRLGAFWEEGLLASGELEGSGSALWRARGSFLRGTGFNLDFGEESLGPVPIVEPGDLLVTSGLDGLFPPGIEVAVVSQVRPRNEGAYFSELEARPIANLDDLELLFVWPPIAPER
jgi:cell shape-determining protein MreC